MILEKMFFLLEFALRTGAGLAAGLLLVLPAFLPDDPDQPDQPDQPAGQGGGLPDQPSPDPAGSGWRLPAGAGFQT